MLVALDATIGGYGLTKMPVSRDLQRYNAKYERYGAALSELNGNAFFLFASR